MNTVYYWWSVHTLLTAELFKHPKNKASSQMFRKLSSLSVVGSFLYAWEIKVFLSSRIPWSRSASDTFYARLFSWQFPWNTSGVILPHGMEVWRIGRKRLVLLWPRSFGLWGCVTKRRKTFTPSLKHRWESSQNIKKNSLFSFESSVTKECIVRLVIPVSFHCLL